MEKCDRVELLAPAGNPESFYGALHAGADAVYLAGDRFGARAYAENFTAEELLKCIRYGHLLGRKIYLTVNTLLKETELKELCGYLRPFCEAGLDAVIVQDLGVFRRVREYFPYCKIHVSTQMTLCGGWGASLLKKLGACRVVPARELSLQELVTMKEQSGMEIEAFIHGAMCYCYSGQCLFSSILGGRSGNRGRCAQPCRLPYSVKAKGINLGEGYPLSLKDMCTVEHIPRLIEAGIDSFKVEGRMKRPEYAAGVVSVYRRYIDRYYDLREKRGAAEAAEAFRVEKEDRRLLHSVYIRSEVQDGYFFRRNGPGMVTLDSPAYRKTDDRILSEIRKKYIDNPLKLPVSVYASFQSGKPAEAVMQWKDIRVSVTGAEAAPAQKQPVTEETVLKHFGRLGESVFDASQIEVSLGENCFYPLKQMNELRRAGVMKLEQAILRARGYGEDLSVRNMGAAEDNVNCSGETVLRREGGAVPEHTRLSASARKQAIAYAFSVRTLEQLEKLSLYMYEKVSKPVRLYVEGDLLLEEWDGIISLWDRFPDGSALYAALPFILREADRSRLERLYEKISACDIFRGFLVRSMDGLGYVREKGDIPCRLDPGVYVWNSAAWEELSAMAEGFCLPYELRASEQRAVLESLKNKFTEKQGEPLWEKIIYGRIPMMLTANCVFGTGGGCRKGKSGSMKGGNRYSALTEQDEKEHIAMLRDRYGRTFPVLADCRHCMNIIYNSVPYSLRQEMSRWEGNAGLRMDFTLENGEEVEELLDSFIGGKAFPHGEYTTGHEKRGVE